MGIRRWRPPKPTKSRDNILLKRQMTAAFAVNVLLLVGLLGAINTLPLNRELFTGQWERDMDEVDPGLFWELTYNTGESALRRANELLSKMELGQVRTLDEMTIDTVLYWDHFHGNVLLWKLVDGRLEIWLDAWTGEIVEYKVTEYRVDWDYYPEVLDSATDVIEWPEATVWWRSTIDDTLAVVRQFAEIPSDLVLPEVVQDFSMPLYRMVDSDLDGIEGKVYNCWMVRCGRQFAGVSAEDTIGSILTQEGLLLHYRMDWFMDLRQMSTDAKLSERDAKQIALDTVYSVPWKVEDYTDWDDTELEFIWSGPADYGWPVLTWAVGFWSNHVLPEHVFVDANTGAVIRSVIYQ